ncbi:RasGEF domain-containing protein [Candidatus Berkiella aquae]|uniref:RasGEF domain protein n=1 Tax=Candidatus Berkiella aquae TaxID=295108 RepID=A0A0Q9YRE8_9GAMM|nr:RasGEF domain-containing protein [Candidatus Berkiella aquae]MCS5712162.1 hypothetical protein [Candidatus Berkiella aquae]
MDHNAKSIQRALARFRFIAPITNTNQAVFGDITDILRARVSNDPLTALNELSDVYNQLLQQPKKRGVQRLISNKTSGMKWSENATEATAQQQLVLHALQTLYKQKLDAYLKSIHENAEHDKNAAVEALRKNHGKILNQRPNPQENLAGLMSTMLQAIKPQVLMPTTVQHAPTNSNVQWQAPDKEARIKMNIIKAFEKEHAGKVKKRDEYVAALNRKDPQYAYMDQKAIEQLNAAITGNMKKMNEFTADPNPQVRKAAIEALTEAGLLGKVEDNFLHQLLSGFKNPEKLKENETIEYSPEDIAAYAHSLLTVMKPEEIFQAINQLYQKTTLASRKEQILNNAMILLHELILVDNMQNFFPNFSQELPKDNLTAQAFNGLIHTIKQDATITPELKSLAAAFEQNIKSASDLAAGLKENNQQQINALLSPLKGVTPLDIDQFLEHELLDETVSRKRLDEVAKVIASDFKKIGMAHLVNVKSSDLYRQAWSKADRKEQTNILAFMRYADALTHAIADDIVSAKTIQHQQRIALFYCKVLEESIRTHDYSTAMAIYGAFNTTSVFRQTHLHENKEIAAILDRSKNVLNPTDADLKNLRALMNDHKDEIVIPYMGMFTKDLTFTDDGSKDRLDNGDINANKLNVLSRIYQRFEHLTKQVKKQKPTGQQSSIRERVNRFKVDEDVAHHRSMSFRARTILLSDNMPLGELLAKFPAQAVPVYLEVKIKKDEKESVLLNKKAYKFIIKQIIKNAHQANEVDKAAAYNLINNIAKVAEKNNLDTKRLNKLIEAARVITEVDADTQNTIDFVKNATDKYHQTTSLQAELKEHGNHDAAKPLAIKAEEIKDKLTKATTNPDKQISELAKKALVLVDLMANIPTLSEKYQSLKTEFTTMQHGPDSLKRKISIQDQMDNIEEQLRKAAKHSDPRIRTLAENALTAHKISEQKVARFPSKAPQKAQVDKRKAMLISPHRPLPLSEAVPVTVVTPDASATPTQKPPSNNTNEKVMNDFINDLVHAKTILEKFHGKPKYKEQERHSLKLILKQLNEANTAHATTMHDPAFNISFREYDKFYAVSTLDYVARSLKDNPGIVTIERLLNETSKNWPEGKELLTNLKATLSQGATLSQEEKMDARTTYNPRR